MKKKTIYIILALLSLSFVRELTANFYTLFDTQIARFTAWKISEAFAIAAYAVVVFLLIPKKYFIAKYISFVAIALLEVWHFFEVTGCSLVRLNLSMDINLKASVCDAVAWPHWTKAYYFIVFAYACYTFTCWKASLKSDKFTPTKDYMIVKVRDVKSHPLSILHACLLPFNVSTYIWSADNQCFWGFNKGCGSFTRFDNGYEKFITSGKYRLISLRYNVGSLSHNENRAWTWKHNCFISLRLPYTIKQWLAIHKKSRGS